MTDVVSDNMANLAAEFNRYFNNQVQLNLNEKTTAYNEVMPILEKLAKYINKKDPRFGSEIIKVGSSFQGLKVEEPNEFDVNIPLMGTNLAGPCGWGPYKPRYYDIQRMASDNADSQVSTSQTTYPVSTNQMASRLASANQMSADPVSANRIAASQVWGTSQASTNWRAANSRSTNQMTANLGSANQMAANHRATNWASTNQKAGPGLPPNYHLQQMVNGKYKNVDEVRIYQTSQAQPHPGNGYTFVEVSDTPMWLNALDVVFDGDMIPILIKKEFKRILIEGIRESGFKGKVVVDRKFHGPAITIQVDGKYYKISVDMSVVIDRGGTFPSYAGWPHPNTSWPSLQKKDIISNIGVSFVAKKDLHWMVSSALAEREIMRGIDEDGGCRKKCHRIMKKLNEDYWSKGNKALSSYTLKNLLFWECEKLPNSASWTNDKMADRICCMTKSLYEKICRNELNIFFIPVRNLLKKETEDERRALSLAKANIEKFLQNPLAVMQILNAKG